MKSTNSPLSSYIIFLTLISVCSCQYLIISHPQNLSQSFKNSSIKVNSSPIGFKPKAGTIHGRLVLANPLSACNQIQQIDYQQQQDIFLLADDIGCLESVKAHNLADSGAYIGIIKKNINNTLYDKSVDLVHIPILQIQPHDYQIIINYMQKNPNTIISMLADFNPNTNSNTSTTNKTKKINMQLWLSPTQQQAYQYILQFWKFITKQQQYISFTPHFVLHSQTSRKQYIGCYSSGRYCPPQLQYQGKPQGSKIVGQALRQIIIANKMTHKWFDYISYYYRKCLKGQTVQTLWQQQNSQLCSQSAMMNAQINSQQIFKQYNSSFKGPRPQVDGNIYLQNQRQLYLSQKVTQFPVLLINGKQYTLQIQNEDIKQIKLRICTMIHPDVNQQTQQCKKLANPPVFTTAQLFVGIGVLIVLMVIIMCVCKQTIYRKMKKQMQGEVDKTLTQYYRYMETFQAPDNVPTGKVPLMEEKVETNQLGSVELSDMGTNK